MQKSNVYLRGGKATQLSSTLDGFVTKGADGLNSYINRQNMSFLETHGAVQGTKQGDGEIYRSISPLEYVGC
jgi:hypothetical protein